MLKMQDAILINCSRGPVIDEVALVEHLKENPMFRVGLDVFEVFLLINPSLLILKILTTHYDHNQVNTRPDSSLYCIRMNHT